MANIQKKKKESSMLTAIINLRDIDPIKDQDKCLTWWAVCWTRHTVTHVDLTLPIICTRTLECKYCPLVPVTLKSRCRRTGIHNVTFFILKKGHHRTVTCQLEKNHKGTHNYRRILIPLTIEQHLKIRTFLEIQLDQSFNYWGYWWNFLCWPKWCCVYGYHHQQDALQKRKWFCSELCTTALIYGGILELPSHIQPCQITPGKLAFLLGDTGFEKERILQIK